MLIAPKDYKTKHRKYVDIKELDGENFISQRESTDADVQQLFEKYNLTIRSTCHVVDDLSQIAMVASGLGICIMPQLVMQNIPFDVSIYPLRPSEHRTIGICTLNDELMAPAVKSMYKQILNYFKSLK
jgi:DNA-binding transcriptional LysR family regulator